MSPCICYNFLLKLDILSNNVAILDSDLPPPLPVIFVAALLSTFLFGNLPGLKMYNPFPLRYVAPDGCAQLGFGKSGFSWVLLSLGLLLFLHSLVVSHNWSEIMIKHLKPVRLPPAVSTSVCTF